jgi:flagellin
MRRVALEKPILSGLASVINNYAGTTGVTAKLNDSKTGLILEQSNGYDIQLKGTGDATANLSRIQGLKFDATSSGAVTASGGFIAAGASGSLVVAAGASGYATVGGQVTFESGKSFSVVASGTNARLWIRVSSTLKRRG